MSGPKPTELQKLKTKLKSEKVMRQEMQIRIQQLEQVVRETRIKLWHKVSPGGAWTPTISKVDFDAETESMIPRK